MSITIKELAKLAGVGRATVDRALKNKSGINEETKNKILTLAADYDYKPNTIGKALVYINKKHIIGVILNSIGNDFFNKVIEGLKKAEEEITDYGFECKYLFLKSYNVEEQLKAIEQFNKSINSLIITPINHTKILIKLNGLAREGVNIIAINSDIKITEKLCYIGCDYNKSGKTAGNLVGLLSKDDAKLLVVTGSLCMQGHTERVLGLAEKLKNEFQGVILLKVIENNDDETESYLKVKEELEKNPEINFICLTAGGVKGACKATMELGKKMTVVCFDDTEEIKNLILENYVQATITQQPFEQGYNSVKTLFNYIVNKQKPNSIIHTELNIKIKENI